MLHLILLLLIFGFIIGALRGSLPHLPPRAALLIQPFGQIVEQRSGDPLQIAFNEARGERQSETLLWDLTESIRAAARDEMAVRARRRMPVAGPRCRRQPSSGSIPWSVRSSIVPIR